MELQDTFWGAKYGKVKDQIWHSLGLEFHKMNVKMAENTPCIPSHF
ncbi:hypothetical protein [Peribacillus sp. NPDC096448]